VYSGTTTSNSGTLTVKVYAGSSATGTLLKTYTTTSFAGSSAPYTWSITVGPNNELITGSQYTAQATQPGVTGQATVTFTAH
jgi:hypothetical protein